MLKFQDISAFLGLHAEHAEHVHPSVGQVRQRRQRWDPGDVPDGKRGPQMAVDLQGTPWTSQCMEYIYIYMWGNKYIHYIYLIFYKNMCVYIYILFMVNMKTNQWIFGYTVYRQSRQIMTKQSEQKLILSK